MRALNFFGGVALVLLGLYVGWALIRGDEEQKATMVVPVPADRAKR